MANIENEIILLEEELRQAMLASNTKILDKLISDDLVFTNHFGQLLTKQSDLETHQSGMLNFSSLEPSEQFVKVLGEVAVVSVRMKITGIYANASFAADLRYTRIWQRMVSGWYIVAGHSSSVQSVAA